MTARQVVAGALSVALVSRHRNRVAVCAVLGAVWTGVAMIPVPPPVPPACAVEDGSSGPVPCVWIAADHGNRVGDNFIIRADGTVWSLDGAVWLGDVFGTPGEGGGR